MRRSMLGPAVAAAVAQRTVLETGHDLSLEWIELVAEGPDRCPVEVTMNGVCPKTMVEGAWAVEMSQTMAVVAVQQHADVRPTCDEDISRHSI